MMLRKPAFAVMLLLVSTPAVGRAGTKRHLPAPDKPPEIVRTTYVLQNCDLPTVFQVLANEAHVKLDLDPSVRGTINMQLEDMETKQAIEVIAQAENLSLQISDGTYHIKASAQTDDSHKGGVKPADGFEAFGQALATAYGGVIDTVTKTEVAEKFAKYKHNYYLALVKEGFTTDEALKIVIASSDPSFSDSQKGK